MEVTFSHPRVGVGPTKWEGVTGIQMLPFMVLDRLSDEFHRLLDERVHVTVVIDERNYFAVACEDLLDGP